MKKVLLISSIVSLVSVLLCLVSCKGDDSEDIPVVDDATGIGAVFPMGLPKSAVIVGNMICDDSGRLVSCTMAYTTEIVNFDYAEDKVRIVYENILRGKYVEAHLGENGYVDNFIINKYNGAEPISVTCEYNGSGHLVGMHSQNGINRKVNDYVIKHNGKNDILWIKNYQEYTNSTLNEKKVKTYSFEYTDDNVSVPIENKSGIMLIECIYYQGDWFNYNETHPINNRRSHYARDCFLEWIPMYYAGLLGKGSAHMPVRVNNEDTGEYVTYKWEIMPDGRPLKVREEYFLKFSEGWNNNVYRWE